MSSRGCQLLVSPCNVSPSMSVMGGHRASPQRVSLGSRAGTDKVKKRVNGSFAPESHNGSQVVLPSLWLHRQVLTNGKDGSAPGQPPRRQVPAQHGLAAAGPCSSQGTSFKTPNPLAALPSFSLQKNVSGGSPWLTAHSGIDN